MAPKITVSEALGPLIATLFGKGVFEEVITLGVFKRGDYPR